MFKKRSLSVMIAMATAGLVACGGNSSSDSNSNGSDDNSAVETRSVTTTGTIDGFGSVIVNGVHYGTDDADFEVDENPGVQGDLSVGQVVTIVATVTNGVATAASVTYDDNIEGPVTSIDAANNQFVALGQTVIVDSLTVFEGVTLDTLQVGDSVEVSGINDASGNIWASYVELDTDADTEVELQGTVSSHDSAAQTFMINAQLVNYGTAGSIEVEGGSIQDGMFVEVEGEMSGATLVATEVEEETTDLELDQEMEVEGYVTSLNTDLRQFEVRGITVEYSDDTEFENGSAASIALDMEIEVEGVVDENGILQATEIDLEIESNIEIEADVEAVDADNGTVTLLGQTFQVNYSTLVLDERDGIHLFNISDIAVGDRVEVEAYKNDTGELIAVKLERDEADVGVSISAPVDSFDQATSNLVLAGVSVDLSSQELSIEDDNGALTLEVFFATVQLGNILEISGSLNGSVVAADSVEIEQNDD